MAAPARTALLVLIAVGVLMLLEAMLSRRNERRLRASGAIEPQDDVYLWMQVAYPAGFLLMGVEGALQPVPARDGLLWGAAIFTAAKALKYWAMASLGSRWSFRVLVVPAPLVTSGPYRFLRHPNYVGVVGELVGAALMLSAAATGTLVTLGFSWLIWKRIGVEERALGRTRAHGER